jgi:antitoxin ParD1/3/4
VGKEELLMSLTLTPRLDELIRQQIDIGRYRTVDEVIQEAQEAFEERDRLRLLGAKMQVGIDQLDRDEGVLFTPEWWADRLRLAVERAQADEKPNPEVFP